MGGSNGLWLPDSAREKVLQCTICGKKFGETEVQAHEQHVIHCVRANEEVPGQAIADKESSLFSSAKGPDPERFDHERGKR